MSNPANDALFSSDLWELALENYACDTHLSVKLFDADERVVLGPIHPTPLFQLFEELGYDPGMFAECARRCLEQTESRPTVIVSEFYGLAVVGTSLVLEGKVVGAAVGGYAFVDFSQESEVQRMALDSGIKFERLWQVVREQKPIPKHRLLLNGKLLQVLGDALLRAIWYALRLRETEDRLHKMEKMADASHLAASMAHEINNPLESVTNALYILGTHAKLDESVRYLVTIATTELARVSRIVKQSLSYYRVGTIPYDLDLGSVVNESLEILSWKFRQAGIELKPKIDNGTVLVGFPDELRQAIDNVLLNALEAMSSGGGRLSVAVHESFDWTHNHNHKHRKGVRLTIADTGCGIPRENRKRILEPFFTTKARKGNGLGLWIMQGIILKHGGNMRLRSSETEGKSGTVISIFLPSHFRAPIPAKAEPAA